MSIGSWSDVIIGNGMSGSSAIHVFSIEGEHNISENKKCFWISDSSFGIGLTIFKNMPEGICLQKMIDDKEPLGKIEDWIDGIVLKYAEPSLVKERIMHLRNEAYELGKKAKAKQILNALGLNGNL